MKCAVCDEPRPVYRDWQSGDDLCLQHARLAVIGPRQGDMDPPEVRAAEAGDMQAVLEMVDHFWGETDVDAFGQEYDLAELPAFVAVVQGEVVGAASYVLEGEQVHLVSMQVRPDFQGRGAGRRLVEAVLDEGRAAGARRAVLVTSNDDLPALSLYQRMGFVITEVVVGALLEHHGGVSEAGFAGIPVRDEVRMAREV